MAMSNTFTTEFLHISPQKGRGGEKPILYEVQRAGSSPKTLKCIDI